jgi:hypothetical protein
MSNDRQSAFSSGFALLWRRQRVLWWIFAVNFVCGLFGALPGFMAVRRAVGHSLAARELTHRFDLGMFVELLRAPDTHIWRYNTASFLFAAVFFVFMLFVTGGVLETYLEDRRLSTGEFFGASGAYFWPFVRLALLSIIPFAIVAIIHYLLDKQADRIGEQAIADQVGIFLGWGAIAILLLLGLAVRLWFDVAKVRAVALKERRMWRTLWRAWRLTWHDFFGLYWLYFRIVLLAWITCGLGLWLWTKLPPTSYGLVFLVLELIVLAQVAARLWQLAGVMSWYQWHGHLVASDVATFTAPAVLEPVDPEPASTLEEIVVEKTSAYDDIAPEATPLTGDDFSAAGPADAPASPPREPGPHIPPEKE